MAVYFLDTNILIDWVGEKQSADFFREHLSIETQLATGIVCLTEFLVKASKHEEQLILKLIESEELEVCYFDDLEIAKSAAKLRKEVGVKLPDALILAMAIRLEAHLLTCDQNLLKKSRGLLKASDPTKNS